MVVPFPIFNNVQVTTIFKTKNGLLYFNDELKFQNKKKPRLLEIFVSYGHINERDY